MPPLTLHHLRHAFATLGLVGGMAAKTVSEHLGHASVVITLDLYSHVLPNMQEELVNVVANLLKRTPAVDQPTVTDKIKSPSEHHLRGLFY